MMLLIACMPDGRPETLSAYAMTLKIIDDWMIIGGAYGCVITGAVYGTFTNWGFFRHRWIVVKWVMTLLMILSGTFCMGPYVNGNAALGADKALYALPDGIFWQNIDQIVPWGILQLAMLATVIAISVLKPWKKKSARQQPIDGKDK